MEKMQIAVPDFNLEAADLAGKIRTESDFF